MLSGVGVRCKIRIVMQGLRLLNVEPRPGCGVAMVLLLLHQRWHSPWLKLVVWCYNTRMPSYSSGEMIVIRVLYYCCARGNRARRKRVNMAKRTHAAKKLFKQSHAFHLLSVDYTTTLFMLWWNLKIQYWLHRVWYSKSLSNVQRQDRVYYRVYISSVEPVLSIFHPFQILASCFSTIRFIIILESEGFCAYRHEVVARADELYIDTTFPRNFLHR